MSSEMNINRQNYESFFLDYLEGNLEDPLHAELMAFLAENPDLASELEGLDEMFLEPGRPSPLHFKDRLRRDIFQVGGIDGANVDEKLIASLEGDLNSEEEGHLEEFLRQNPAYNHDRELFRAAVLQPEKEIVFIGKERLKRRMGVLIAIRWHILGPAAAALLLLLLGWRILLPPGVPPEKPAIAESNSAAAGQLAEPYRIGSLPSGAVALSPAPPSRPVKNLQSATVPETSLSDAGAGTRTAPVILDPVAAGPIASLTFQPVLIQRYYTRDVLADLQAYEEEPATGTLVGRVVRNLGQRVKEGRDQLQGDPGEGERNISFWSLADLGIQGYNKLADREVELDVVRNKSGRPMEYSFSEGERTILSREIGQP